jgi:hypothetical protein
MVAICAPVLFFSMPPGFRGGPEIARDHADPSVYMRQCLYDVVHYEWLKILDNPSSEIAYIAPDILH